MLKVFRILPKDLAADVFSYLDMDNQQKIITSLSDKEATNIINNLMADDAADLLEEMPANIVKKLLTNASPEVRRDINHLLRYPEDSAGSIITVEYVVDTIPRVCPCCGQPTRIHESSGKGENGEDRIIKTLYCDNPDCETRRLKKFVHFVSQKAMDIEGLSEAALEKFIGQGFILMQ